MNNINPYQLLYYNQDYLMHHGIKGMKWGVRHERDTTGKRASSQNKKK